MILLLLLLLNSTRTFRRLFHYPSCHRHRGISNSINSINNISSTNNTCNICSNYRWCRCCRRRLKNTTTIYRPGRLRKQHLQTGGEQIRGSQSTGTFPSLQRNRCRSLSQPLRQYRRHRHWHCHCHRRCRRQQYRHSNPSGGKRQ